MASSKVLTDLFLRKIPESEEYTKRLEEELVLIEKFQFTQVFLQVVQILTIARRLHIPHIIRGSAGSSLVCFLLGITEIDPVLYKLELARFMNTGRQDLPDIDIDVPYNRREELYKEIAAQWPNMVARISNHVTYGSKVALRESAKEVLLESYPAKQFQDTAQKKILKQLQRKQFQLKNLLTPTQEEDARQRSSQKLGQFKHYSKHCGGIVIFEKEGEVPNELRLASDDSCLSQICLNKDEAEDRGYIKIDVLSNRGLAQLVDAQVEPRELLAYPIRDPKTEALFARGDNLGITFGESRGMRKLFVGLKPRFMEDIAIALALIRPAAATRGRKSEFLERWKHDAEALQAPEFRQILYDDDAIALCREVLGCSSSEADRWRKVFAKQNPAGRIEFRKALYRKGVPKPTQDHIMEELDYLALYSFCKSHAISYAQLVWALGYEKAHNPHRFWCAALNHCHSEYRKWVHYREARCTGLQLSREKPPYKVVTKDSQARLVPIHSQGTQLRLTDMFQTKALSDEAQAIQDMKQLGYWISEAFLPNCGVWIKSQQTLLHWFGSYSQQSEVAVTFRGLIATGRVLKRDGLVTLLTIGVENQRYVDLVLADTDRSDLFKWGIVEGKGQYTKKGLIETITVETIKGISYEALRTA